MKWLTQLDHVACKWRCAFTTAQTGFRTVFCLDACFGFLWYKLLHPTVCFQLSFFTTIQFSRHVWRERLSATMSRALVSRKTMTLVYKHLKMCLMSNEGLLSPRCGSLQSVSGHSLHTDAPACGPDNQVMTLGFFFSQTVEKFASRMTQTDKLLLDLFLKFSSCYCRKRTGGINDKERS